MTITKIKRQIIAFCGTISLIFIGYASSRFLMYLIGYDIFGEHEVYIAMSSFSLMIVSIYAYDRIRSKVETISIFSVSGFSNYIRATEYLNDFAYICINDFEPPYKTSKNKNVLSLNIDDNYLNDIPHYIASTDDNGKILKEHFPASKEILTKIVKFIDANRHKKAILIHCGLGISRSTAIAKYANQRFNLISAKTFDNLQISTGKHINNHIYTNLMTIKGLKEH